MRSRPAGCREPESIRKTGGSEERIRVRLRVRGFRTVIRKHLRPVGGEVGRLSRSLAMGNRDVLRSPPPLAAFVPYPEILVNLCSMVSETAVGKAHGLSDRILKMDGYIHRRPDGPRPRMLRIPDRSPAKAGRGRSGHAVAGRSDSGDILETDGSERPVL